MYFKQISEPKLAHNAYLIGCQESGQAIIIDPMRDIDRYLGIAADDGLNIVAATETHIHADYLSGLRQFAELKEIKVYASDEGDQDWKYEWLSGSSYNYELVGDGSQIDVGNCSLKVLSTPGHTPEHISFLVIDRSRAQSTPLGLVSGDFVFVGDVGRPDLLETAAGQVGKMHESAEVLFDSLQQFKQLSPDLMLWPGHGAGSACGKSLGAAPVSTVGQELTTNPSLQASSDKKTFMEFILDGQPEPPPYFARMKTLNRSGPAVLATFPKPEQLASDQIERILADENLILIDTRSWEEFCAGHLPGSLFIPAESAFSTLIGSYVQPDQSICFIIEASEIDEAVRQSIRVGLDLIVSYLTPSQLRDYSQSGGELATVDEIEMRNLGTSLSLPDTQPVDVRRAAELKEIAPINGALNIAHTQLRLRCDELPTDKNLHIYCRTANRSRYATSFLKSKGFEVTHVRGGIVQWE